MWAYAKNKYSSKIKGWLGFRESHSNTNDFSTSRILPLKFANAPPSDYKTIYTVLLEAARKAMEVGQKHAFVTFDQPLNWKAREILASIDPINDRKNILLTVIVR